MHAHKHTHKHTHTHAHTHARTQLLLVGTIVRGYEDQLTIASPNLS